MNAGGLTEVQLGTPKLSSSFDSLRTRGGDPGTGRVSFDRNAPDPIAPVIEWRWRQGAAVRADGNQPPGDEGMMTAYNSARPSPAVAETGEIC